MFFPFILSRIDSSKRGEIPLTNIVGLVYLFALLYSNLYGEILLLLLMIGYYSLSLLQTFKEKFPEIIDIINFDLFLVFVTIHYHPNTKLYLPVIISILFLGLNWQIFRKMPHSFQSKIESTYSLIIFFIWVGLFFYD